MKAFCTTQQETDFETRFVRRLAELVFLPRDELARSATGPVILFGSWWRGDAEESLRWLSSMCWALPFPTILFPPLPPGPLGRCLGNEVSLSVEACDENSLLVVDQQLQALVGRPGLTIQTDASMDGPGGRNLVTTAHGGGAVCIVQPKNTDMPLILCGAGVLNASGLSTTQDRSDLFAGLLSWCGQKVGDPALPLVFARKGPSQAPLQQAREDVLNTVAVLVAAFGETSPVRVVGTAKELLGLELTVEDVEEALALLPISGRGHEGKTDDGQAARSRELEPFLRQRGLWSHVRILSEDTLRGEQR